MIPNGIGQSDPASPGSLNPLIGGTTYTQQAAVLLYRPLVWIGQDGRFDAERSLAATITPLDRNTRFRVTLKPWRWSDGQPVTADDVLFTWELIGKLGPLFAYQGQGGIPDRVAAVRVVSATQVDFVLNQPTNPDWFALNGLSLITPLPRHAWGDPSADDLWRRQTDPSLVRVTDGPFQLAEFQPDRYAVYTPNPLYGGHKAQLARLVTAFLEGDNPLHAVQSGDADMARVPFALWARLQGKPGFSLIGLPEPYGYYALALNQRNAGVGFLRDAAVRRALAQAVDQASIIRLVYRGVASENHTPIPTAASAWRSPQADAGNGLAYDAQAAAAALQAAGWVMGPDGIRARGGQPLQFTLLSGASGDDAPEMQMLQIVQGDLRRIGVAMRLRRVSFDALLEIANGPASGWDALAFGETLFGMPDGGGYFDTGGNANFGGYSDARMDALIRASVAPESDKYGSQGAMFAYQDYAASQQPWIILPQGQFPLIVANRLHGVAQFQNPSGYWSPEYLWVDDGQCAVASRAKMR